MPDVRKKILFGLCVVVLKRCLPAPSRCRASVRACIGEADATQRLACYDREVARLIAPATAPSLHAAGTTAAPAPALAAAMVPTIAGRCATFGGSAPALERQEDERRAASG